MIWLLFKVFILHMLFPSANALIAYPMLFVISIYYKMISNLNSIFLYPAKLIGIILIFFAEIINQYVLCSAAAIFAAMTIACLPDLTYPTVTCTLVFLGLVSMFPLLGCREVFCWVCFLLFMNNPTLIETLFPWIFSTFGFMI
jgi:hypothetical protein